MAELGVNIDHVATVRQARRAAEPDPVWAATLAELGGADGITLHLREDRRHIQERDLRVLRETVAVKLNLEMACEPGVIAIARDVRPDQITLVPEKREEVTTEGGLDVVTSQSKVADTVAQFRELGITVSLFVDAEASQIEAAKRAAADAVELHTGPYALAKTGPERSRQLETLCQGGALARQLSLTLHAGHGLNYHNVRPIAAIGGMTELNIGHSIIARAVMVGMERAVREMKQLISS